MKVLLSAFAFSPILGSECGVGWHWALALARRHEVTVLTHAWFRKDVEDALVSNPVKNLRVEYFHVEPFWAIFRRSHLDSQIYITYWQICVRGFAKQLQNRDGYDLAHHLTLGSIRYPSWLGFVAKRYIVGPLGGGERAPARFYRGLPWRNRLHELLRDVVLYSFKVDPFAQSALSRAEKIFCRTRDTARFIPKYLQRKVVVAHEVGAPDPCPRAEPVRVKPRTSFLFAGRLLSCKGMHLAIPALAQAVARGADVDLTIIGDGSLLSHLQAQARECGVTSRVVFRPRIPQSELMALYHSADAFLFPSLHDSGGTVVLESMSRGLPVICVDLGGPPNFVDAECGLVVSTRDASQAELIGRLSDALVIFAAYPQEKRQSLHDECVRRSREMTWGHRVSDVYDLIDGNAAR